MEEVKKIILKRPQLRDGENRVFRKGKIRKYKTGEFVDLVHSNNNEILTRARIIDLKYKKYQKIEDIDITYACESSFKSQGNLLTELKLNSFDDFVTIIILSINKSNI